MGHMKEKMTVGRFFVYLFAILFAFVCLYPFLMVIGGSLMTNSEVVNEGFKVFPKEVTFASYKLLLGNGNLILNGYKITLFVTVVGTFCSIIVNGMMGYVLSRKRVAGRKFMNLYVLLTMLFNGGMVPWYLICTRYLHLKNNIFALILPSVVSAWYIFLIRNYFSGIPEEIYEAAKIDGANRWQQCWHVTLAGIKPIIAINLIMQVGSILSTNSDLILLLYTPATYDVADVIGTYTYRMGILNGEYSFTTAAGLFMSVIGFALTYICNKISNKLTGFGLW